MVSARLRLRRLAALLHVVENWMLVVLVVAIVAVAMTQIVARNLFDTGFPLAEPFLRVGVLWLGMFGAVVAARTNHHIKIDALTRFVPPRVIPWLNFATFGFTAAVAGVLAWVSGRFVLAEYEFDSQMFGVVPAWPFEAILPVGFGLIAVRYAMHAVVDFGTPPVDPGPSPRSRE